MIRLVDWVVDVDGEELHLLDEPSTRLLVNEPFLAQGPSDSWMQWHARFVLEHNGFVFAWHVVGPRKSRLWLVLQRIGDRWQRVHIDVLQCARCRKELLAADPYLSGLYIGVADESAALDLLEGVPSVSCPECGESLPMTAIWAVCSTGSGGQVR